MIKLIKESINIKDLSALVDKLAEDSSILDNLLSSTRSNTIDKRRYLNVIKKFELDLSNLKKFVNDQDDGPSNVYNDDKYGRIEFSDDSYSMYNTLLDALKKYGISENNYSSPADALRDSLDTPNAYTEPNAFITTANDITVYIFGHRFLDDSPIRSLSDDKYVVEIAGNGDDTETTDVYLSIVDSIRGRFDDWTVVVE